MLWPYEGPANWPPVFNGAGKCQWHIDSPPMIGAGRNHAAAYRGSNAFDIFKTAQLNIVRFPSAFFYEYFLKIFCDWASVYWEKRKVKLREI